MARFLVFRQKNPDHLGMMAKAYSVPGTVSGT